MLKDSGQAYVKEGGLSATWVDEAADVIQIALSGNRIGVVKDDGVAWVKEGSLSAGWVEVSSRVTGLAFS